MAEENLEKILSTMDLPKDRISKLTLDNLLWLHRNFAINNAGHPAVLTARMLIQARLRELGA